MAQSWCQHEQHLPFLGKVGQKTVEGRLCYWRDGGGINQQKNRPGFLVRRALIPFAQRLNQSRVSHVSKWVAVLNQLLTLFVRLRMLIY